MSDILANIRDVLNMELFTIGGTPFSLTTLISVVLIVLAALWVSKLLRRVATRALESRGGKPGHVGTVTGLIHYAVLVIAFGIALDTAGIDLTALFAAGAIFAVGLGFAMQSIAQNFVAGVILLAERAIKPGDILEVEGKVVKVVEMGIRASVGRSRDGEDLIIPNATLIQTTVKNYTLRNPVFRVRIPVGVVYRSDMALVRRVLLTAAKEIAPSLSKENHEPQVILTRFGDNAVEWEVAVWIDDPWDWRPATSQIMEAVWWALKKEDIVIAFPQLDVHLDSPIEQSFARLAGASAA